MVSNALEMSSYSTSAKVLNLSTHSFSYSYTFIVEREMGSVEMHLTVPSKGLPA